MLRISKPIQVIVVLVAVLGLSACGARQAAAPTPTIVDVNAVMTSAAATAFVQLTQIAGQASATSAPTLTPTPAPPTNTPDPNAPTATIEPALQLLTPTESAGGLPVVGTAQPGAGTAVATSAFSLTPIVPLATSGGTVITCLNSKFVADVTVPDGTVFAPGEKFRKVWRIQNTGTCAWDQGFGLTIWAGPSMGGDPIYFSGHDTPVKAGGTVDLGIDMRAPLTPGDYVAHWIMISDSGKTFGGDFTVVIKVSK